MRELANVLSRMPYQAMPYEPAMPMMANPSTMNTRPQPPVVLRNPK